MAQVKKKTLEQARNDSSRSKCQGSVVEKSLQRGEEGKEVANYKVTWEWEKLKSFIRTKLSAVLLYHHDVNMLKRVEDLPGTSPAYKCY